MLRLMIPLNSLKLLYSSSVVCLGFASCRRLILSGATRKVKWVLLFQGQTSHPLNAMCPRQAATEQGSPPESFQDQLNPCSASATPSKPPQTLHLCVSQASGSRTPARQNSMLPCLDSVVSLLKSVTLEDYLQRRPPCQVVSFHSETCVSDALRILGAVEIKSAPVFDFHSNAFLGFVDSRDVLALVLDLVDVRGTSVEDRVHRLWLAGKRLERETLRGVWPMHDGELVHASNQSCSMYDILRFENAGGRQVQGKQVCHRVGIFDFAEDDQSDPLSTSPDNSPLEDNDPSDMFTEDHVSAGYWSDSGRQGLECTPEVTGREGRDAQESCNETSCASDDRTRHPSEEVVGYCREMRVMSVISQRDVLQLVHQNRDRCKIFFDSSLEALGLGQSPAVCVPCDMPAMNAFGTMMACNVSNVGVVDQRNGGVLVASLSAADFRKLDTREFGVLAMPVLQFIMLHAIRKGRPGGLIPRFESLNDWGVKGGELDKGPKVGTVGGDAVLGKVVEVMLDERCNAVYVLDAHHRPKGVVTKTDVLKLITG